MDDNVIRVKMAEYNVGNNPTTLITIGLGSCVGIALYDKVNKIGGMVHIMLPENKKDLTPAKYADTGIPLLISEMEKIGARSNNIVAKIAGGAQMFSMGESNSTMRVGERNVIKVKEVLKEERIKLIGEDVGRNYGRTMEFYIKNGDVLIRSHKTDNRFL